MSSCAEKLQSCLVSLVQGANAGEELARTLQRQAGKALRNAKGGREPGQEEVEDLVQEFLLKVLTLRARGGAEALAGDWAAMSALCFLGYVRSMLKNLAVDGNPAWDVQRALRDVVKAAVADGLPTPNGLPATLEKGGRFVRSLVAAACADLVARGVPATAAALTSALMTAYAFGARAVDEGVAEALESKASNALEVLDVGATGQAVAATFLHEVGAEGKQVLALRELGFAEMGRRLGLALSTAHARYNRVEHTLKAVAHRLGANREAVARALELLAA